MIFCSQCGQQLPDDARFCVKCGHKVRSTDVENILTQEDPPSTTLTIKKSPLDPTDSQMLYASLTEYLGRHGDERLQIAPDISDKSLRTFLDRTSKHIDAELPLVLFDSSWGEDSPGGWLITTQAIYNDSFLSTDVVPLEGVDHLELGRMENTIRCRAASVVTELDFHESQDLRLPIVRLLESMCGREMLDSRAEMDGETVAEEATVEGGRAANSKMSVGTLRVPTDVSNAGAELSDPPPLPMTVPKRKISNLSRMIIISGVTIAAYAVWHSYIEPNRQPSSIAAHTPVQASEPAVRPTPDIPRIVNRNSQAKAQADGTLKSRAFHTYRVRECIAAATQSQLTEALRYALREDLDGLREYMLSHYPQTITLREGGAVYLIQEGDGYSRVRLPGSGEKYWIQNNDIIGTSQ